MGGRGFLSLLSFGMEERLLVPRASAAGLSLSFKTADEEFALEAHSSNTINIDDVARKDLPMSFSSSSFVGIGRAVTTVDSNPKLS
ncbi:hypothetical protein V6N13_104757 [Hibiscus sabdariffa]|uniref:Uncharacterized protein n=1 Tax=Hibiscus sabdariffa TaxID=183260 RepID=A0ABR2SIR6_9ROSI